MSDEPRTLVIGDVHGHHDRLQALLEREGIIDGEGNRVDGTLPGNDEPVTVVQVGDLGHFGTPFEGDRMCYEAAWKEGWIDILLWGNHDRAVFDSTHLFGGYVPPEPEVKHMMRVLEGDERYKFAHAAHGYLLTHAGLHKQFAYQTLPDGLKRKNPYEVADWLNTARDDPSRDAVVNAVGRSRGGRSPFGGILWRDFEEKLFTEFPQVFGHSASRKHKFRQDPDDARSWCIDIGKGAACLGAIYLPDMTTVRVDL
jgi:hypothetical protein